MVNCDLKKNLNGEKFLCEWSNISSIDEHFLNGGGISNMKKHLAIYQCWVTPSLVN
jgi:hypothetical protein